MKNITIILIVLAIAGNYVTLPVEKGKQKMTK